MLPNLSSLEQKLQHERDAIRVTVERASGDRLACPGPATGEVPSWSAREILAHVVSSEHGLRALANAITGGRGDALPDGYDLNAENARAVSKRRDRSVPDLLREWLAEQEEWHLFLGGVTADQMELTGRHPASPQPITLRALLIVMIRHERAHRQEIAALLTGE